MVLVLVIDVRIILLISSALSKVFELLTYKAVSLSPGISADGRHVLTIELGGHIIDDHGGTQLCDHRRGLLARHSLSKGSLGGAVIALGALLVPSEVQGLLTFVS